MRSLLAQRRGFVRAFPYKRRRVFASDMEPTVEGSWRTMFRLDGSLRREEVAVETSASLSTSFSCSTPSGRRRSEVAFGFGVVEAAGSVETALTEELLPEGALDWAKEAKVGPGGAAPQAPVVLAEAAVLVVVTGGAEEF